uniref:Uncharacterized protein n=1 Tax=Alexandrium monilatum TaxID=311494 RepID=A0A7S4RA22_9DINO
MASSSMAMCPPAAPRLRPSAPPMEVPDFPLLEELALEPLELDSAAPEPKACPPKAPRLRPAMPPVDLSAVPLLELPTLADEGLLAFDSLHSLTLGESAVDEEAALACPEPFLYAAPEALSACSTGTPASSPRSDSPVVAGPTQEPLTFKPLEAPASPPRTPRLRPAPAPCNVFLMPELELPHLAEDTQMGSAEADEKEEDPELPPSTEEPLSFKQFEAPASPPSAPRLRPAWAPCDVFLMPELELPPLAEDIEMGSAEADEEEEVVFVLLGLSDNDPASSDHGSTSSSMFDSSPSDNSSVLQPEAPTPLIKNPVPGCVGARPFENVPPFLERASSSCSTRAPSPRKEIESGSPSSPVFLPELLLA